MAQTDSNLAWLWAGLLYGDVVLWWCWWQMTRLHDYGGDKNLVRHEIWPLTYLYFCHSQTWHSTLPLWTGTESHLSSVLNKISLLSLNCRLIATSLFLWSDQDSSLLPGIEMFTLMTCLAFLIPGCLTDRTTKIQFFFLFFLTGAPALVSRHGVSLVPGAWGLLW